jgi:hypothetical protein
VHLRKTATETFSLLCEAYAENTVWRCHVFKCHKRCSEGREHVEDERLDRPVTMKTDCGKVEVSCENRSSFWHQNDSGGVEYGKETGGRIVTANLNMIKLCAKTVPKSPPVFSHKTNTNTRTLSVLTRSWVPCDFLPFQKLESSLKGTHFKLNEDTHNKMAELLKALLQNGFRRCLEACKVRMGRCVVSSGNYFERGWHVDTII